jgi:16S rRNA processing protein RimM
VAEGQPPRHVKLGRILGAAGLRGWLKVQSYTDPPEGLLRHKRWELRDADGRCESVEVAEADARGGTLRVRLMGIVDRTAAEAVRGRDIEVAHSALPPTAEREYYREGLLGLVVRDRWGRVLGRVSHFMEAPTDVLMVVKGSSELWIPAVPRHLVRVDLTGGEIEVDWPADV